MALTVQWSFGGSYEREQVELCGVSLDGSNTLTVGGLANGDGVGVQGGFAGSQPNTLIDSGETLEVAFAEPATEVAYHQSSNLFVTVVGGVVFDLDAFDAGDVSLGTEHLVTDSTDIGVFALFGDVPLSRFVIEASPGGQDGQQLESVTFVVPEAGDAAGGLAGLASAVAIAQRRRRSASPTR
jgi:hypothetical protein